MSLEFSNLPLKGQIFACREHGAKIIIENFGEDGIKDTFKHLKIGNMFQKDVNKE